MPITEEVEASLSIGEIKKRSVSGVIALVSRTFAIQIISFLSTLALTIFLDPGIYGIFYLVSSVVNFLGYFSDIGLAAALIQKKEALEDHDIATTFTVQQILVVSSVVILFALSPFIKVWYHIDNSGMFLLYSMGVSFFLSSLKTLPSILLEREIQFNKLVVPQILETLAFNLVAVIAAWKGLGVNAFSFAVLARGIVGLVAMYIIFPWKPKIGFSKHSFKSLLKYGVPYQANTFLALLKDDGMTIILTKFIGTDGLGYIGWASRWAGLPLRIIMDNLSKVSFPTFARLQHDQERLKKAVEINIKYLCLATFPVLIAFAFLAKPLIFIIPKYSKWLPALIPLYIYLYNSAWAGISTSLTNLLNSIGKIKVTFKLMIMWTSLTWATMPFLAYKFGYLGASYATFIIATSSIVTIFAARKYVSFNLYYSLKTPVISSAVLGLLLYLLTPLVHNTLSIFGVSFLGILTYSISVITLDGKEIMPKLVQIIKHRNA